MSNFLSNMIGRHAGSENVVAPRASGVFEPRQASMGRPNIPAPLLGNEEGTADNESNSQFSLNEQSTLDETPKVTLQVSGNKAVKKDRTIFSTRQHLQKQIMAGSVSKRGDGQTTSLHREATSTRLVQLAQAQQGVFERVRFEVSKEEKDSVGFSTKISNHQGMEVKPPTVPTKAYTKTDAQYSKHATEENLIDGSHPSIAQPVITVHIGRIEIKAVKEVPSKQAKAHIPERRLSLDEFLKKRDNKL
jgi:hypothetical protein